MSSSLTADQIREKFLEFFERRTHRRVASSSLVPANDPTLLFVNAGMVQFKDVFTGREQREYQRATSSQKCVRAGGKHNDLDNVGFTARHHTFFEMLGNFSFGDYFKADAIAWAWQFVTEVLKLPTDRLAVTVFKGEAGIAADDEAFDLWAKAGVPRHRIFKLGLKDNFWSMGDTGPCGPCSEIYVYQPDGAVPPGDEPGPSENWLEIWNLVFMQFERKVAGGPLLPLPRPSIDTGAGLERVASVVQGKKSNYDTDLFTPLLARVAALAGKPYGADEATSASMRVIADHSRAAAFLLADGVVPSNEGRGYVLRRIMRRAIRHGHQKLGLRAPFMHHTVEAVIALMGKAYPELTQNQRFILEATQHEEASFRRALEKGIELITEEIRRLKASGEKVLKGETVWFLHDTHGMPPDVTQIMLREHGLDAEDSKKPASVEAGEFANKDKAISDVWLALRGRVGDTTFQGYEGAGLESSGRVVALVKGGAEVNAAGTGDEVDVVLDRTPFYAESGGQVGDTGTLSSDSASLTVLDTHRPAGGLFAHRARVTKGAVKVGDTLALLVDGERRTAIRANHSATHLLHRALRVVLGEGVRQAGSVVGPDALRFDYSTFTAASPEQLEQVEDLVNQWVRQNAPAQTTLMGLAEAKAAGAMALFSEKYGDTVRVVSVHPESTELCGGTHVKATGDIGLFKITSESSIASGVRRVTAVTGGGALKFVRELEHELKKAAEVLKVPPKEVVKRIETNGKRIKELEKRLEDLQIKGASSGHQAAENVREVNGIKVLTHQVDQADAKVLRGLADRYRDQLQSGVVGVGGATADGKALILVALTKDLVAKGMNSGHLVRQMAELVGGSGGGKADMAQAGGSDPSHIPQALERLYELVKA